MVNGDVILCFRCSTLCGDVRFNEFHVDGKKGENVNGSGK